MPKKKKKPTDIERVDEQPIINEPPYPYKDLNVRAVSIARDGMLAQGYEIIIEGGKVTKVSKVGLSKDLPNTAIGQLCRKLWGYYRGTTISRTV
jgi:hypothetical protein